MIIGSGGKLLMIGDSITDADRVRAAGESIDGRLGNGYVCLVDALIGAIYPQEKIHIINRGISGNTVRDLKNRWQADVFDLKPDWLSIMIGINDVWNQFGEPPCTEKAVYIDEYTRTLDELITQTKPVVKGIILLAPYYIEPNLLDPMRIQMDVYGAEVYELSQKHKTIFVDVQEAFDKVLTIYDPAALAEDQIHPNQVGHMIIARAFLNAINFNWQ
jgi:lysophospholipase L1-like esterase